MFVLWLFYVIGNSSQSELAYNIKKALRANDYYYRNDEKHIYEISIFVDSCQIFHQKDSINNIYLEAVVEFLLFAI